MTYVKGGALLNDMILALGLQIAFYYGLTGLASAWYFRRDTHRAADLWSKIILPLLGGIILLTGGVWSAVQFWSPAPAEGGVTIWGVSGKFILGVGSIALGIPLMIWWNLRRPGREYFSGRTMASADEVVLDAAREEREAARTRPEMAG